MKTTHTKKQEIFVNTVWTYYREHGRISLPWRQTTDPYAILVSELMLQQTQVDRVIAKYEAFMSTFPDVRSLAEASLCEVLQLWQGLGYNRRAKFLRQATQSVHEEYNGVFPDTYESLVRLPGVGPYTANAILAFAFNKSVVLIETNVRQVYLHHFFKGVEGVSDKEIERLVERTLPVGASREWYSALMDYGTHLKKMHGNLTRQSTAYVKQSTFKGSDREIRGLILKALTTSSSCSKSKLSAELVVVRDRLETQLVQLEKEGFITIKEGCITLS